MGKRVSLRGDGWVDHGGVKGWESFTISTRVVHVDGEPRLVGLNLNPKEDARLSAVVLTTSRLRALPLTHLVNENLQASQLDLFAWAKTAKKTAAKVDRPRGGGTDHAQAVAEVYRAAERTKESPRQAVADAFKVSKQTADRYIKEARVTGVLEPYKRGATRG